MKRRAFIGSGVAAAAMPGLARAASGTLTVTIISVLPSVPAKNADVYGTTKGTMNFKFWKSSAPTKVITPQGGLIAYGNNNRPSNKVDHDCTELIRRYATDFGFGSPSGDGSTLAKGFAGVSGGLFLYVVNGAANLPKRGAVISIDHWTGVTGHVGIVQNSVQLSNTTGQVTLFDQNMPSSTWKTVEFVKTNGRWLGTMTNKSPTTGITYKPVVTGWADPTG